MDILLQDTVSILMSDLNDSWDTPYRKDNARRPEKICEAGAHYFVYVQRHREIYYRDCCTALFTRIGPPATQLLQPAEGLMVKHTHTHLFFSATINTDYDRQQTTPSIKGF